MRHKKQYEAQYEQFLGKLRRAREEAGLSQAEAAELLLRPQSYVSKCESGERRVDVVELQHFAAIYGKPLSFFAESDG
ncbi:helix-turn-helix domain-containing protein [Dehalococcoidia bacterium]|nr:helix-turn-helix domain-containing protein [Dehalococcoidia bacterium]